VHDVLDDRDLVPDEAEQLATSGYEVGALLGQARAAAADGDHPRLTEIEAELAAAPREPDWPYTEPGADELAALLPTPTPTAPLDLADLADRQYGAWLGRCVGNTMGKPVEGLTAAEVETYLRAAGAWPLPGFVPLLDQLPEGSATCTSQRRSRRWAGSRRSRATTTWTGRWSGCTCWRPTATASPPRTSPGSG
jgi:hypothetical protein